MRRFLKLTAVSIGVIIVLVGAAAVTLPLWLPVEKIKTFIISEVKHRTGRDMTAGTLKINIFQGLELSDVSIKETSKYPGKDFISDKKMLIKYSLPALLNKTLLITEIQFDSPIVTVIKGKDGLFNYSDIMTALMPQKENGNEKVETPILPAGKKDFFKSVILTGLNIKNGIFKYIDYSREKPLEVTLNNLNFYTENLILTMVKPINVSMSFEAVYNTYHIPVEATGKVVLDLKNKNFDLTLTKTTAAGMPCSGTITLRDFRDVFGELYTDIGYNDLLKFTSEAVRKKMKDNNISGDLKIKNKFTFKYEKQIYSQQNSTKVENGFITYKDKKVVENIASNIYLNPDFTMKGDLKCLLAGSSVNAAFTATDIRTLPNGKIEAVIDSPKFAVEYLLALLPEKDASAQSKTPKVIAPAKKIKTNQFATIHIKLTAGALVYKTLETGKVLCEISYKAAKLYVTTQIEAYQGKLLSDISVDLNKTSYSVGVSCDKVEVNKLVENVIAIMPKKETEKNNFMEDMKGKVKASNYIIYILLVGVIVIITLVVFARMNKVKVPEA